VSSGEALPQKRMETVLTLLKPRIWGFRHRLHGRTEARTWVGLLLAIAGLLFWAGIFAVFYRVLAYFQGIEGFGDILARKLLSMVLVTFFAILIFSSILTALSTLYLSRDLPLIHAAPVPIEKIFLARWIESTFDSCWMVVLFGLPVFLAYGQVFGAGFEYYTALACSLLPFCLLASAMGTLIVLVAVICLPANRMRDIFLLLSMVVVILLYFMFRFMRPERLVDPDGLASLSHYLTSLKAPGSPFLPTTWTLETLWPLLAGKRDMAWFYLGLSVSGALAMAFLQTKVARLLYFKGLSKAQVARRWQLGRNRAAGRGRTRFLPVRGKVGALLFKDVQRFFRDHTQWSQLFLMGALIVVYLYNFKVLPIEKAPIRTFYLQNILAFLNMGLAGFVLAAIAVRFVFPAVSMEGQAFWVLRSAPIAVKTYLWVKFWAYVGPLLVLSEILIVFSNRLLSVTPFMMGLSTLTVFFMVLGITAMGVGLGAAYPNFHLENMAQAATGVGGMLFMMLCVGFIGSVILLEAGPVYTIFMARLQGNPIPLVHWIWITLSFASVAGINVLAVCWPMRLGVKRLSQMDA
jgi:ABC-2 type transport system permease protein